jgi:tetratricopeptide (TPR) repeat protein
LSEIVETLRARLEVSKSLEEVLPSAEEVFVVTAEGMQYKQTHPQDFAVQRLLGLTDGLRDLDGLIRDARFYEFFTRRLVAEWLDREILKKSILPELRHVSTSTLSADEARKYLPYFKNAVKHSVDPLAARERLAVVHEKLGQLEECVVQYNFIGDALYRMKKPAQAIKAYHKALTHKPDEVLIVEKISRIYYEAAEELVLKGEHMQAAQLLRNALRVSPEDWQAFEKLVGILSRAGEWKEISDLCERVAKHAKESGNVEVAVNAYRIVLAKVPQPAPFQRKLVNTYLDFGEKQAAAALLREMIARNLDDDEPENALELVEKIARIGQMTPELEELRKRLLKDLGVADGRRGRSGRRLAAALVAAVVLLGYQVWSYFAWAGIEKEAVALAASAGASGAAAPRPVAAPQREPSAQEAPPPVVLDPTPEELRALEVVARCDSFLNRFPISVFRSRAQSLRREHEDRARSLAGHRQRTKDKLIHDANLLLVEGDRRQVARTLKPLLDLPRGHSWRGEAEAMVEKLRSFARSSQELVKEARRLEEGGKPRDAYRVYRQLLEQYPKSQFAKSLTLPVLVESLPSGCHVIRLAESPQKSEFLGTTPFVHRMAPEESFAVELTLFGYYPLRTTLYESDGRYNLFILAREPLWTESLAQKPALDPVFTASDLLLTYPDGRLEALDVRSRTVRGTLKREPVFSITLPPLATAAGVYSIWNDGLLAFLPLDREHKSERPRVEVSLPQTGHGLPTTPLVQLADGRLLVGTSRKRLLFLDPSSLQPTAEAPVPVEPRFLVLLDRQTALAAAASGRLVAIDLDGTRVRWDRVLGEEIGVAPAVVGPSVIALTSARTLRFLDPATGKDRFDLPKLRSKDRVELDSVAGLVYLLNAQNELAAVSSDSGKVLAQRKLQLAPRQLVSLDGAVGIVHRDGHALLVLDATSLDPRWATECEREFAGVRRAGEHLLAWTKDQQLILYSHAPAGPPEAR